jgi:hypothetical protein
MFYKKNYLKKKSRIKRDTNALITALHFTSWRSAFHRLAAKTGQKLKRDKKSINLKKKDQTRHFDSLIGNPEKGQYIWFSLKVSILHSLAALKRVIKVPFLYNFSK